MTTNRVQPEPVEGGGRFDRLSGRFTWETELVEVGNSSPFDRLRVRRREHLDRLSGRFDSETELVEVWRSG